MGLPLEPSAAERRRLTRTVTEFLDEWRDRHDTTPAVWPPTDPARIAEFLQAPTEDGRDIAPLLDIISKATETGFDTAGRGSVSYIPSGGITAGALGTLVGSVTNQYTGSSHATPGMVALEESVIRWMTNLFALPEGSGGVLVSGGSIANQIAVVTARSRFGDDFHDGVLYTSVQAHHSIEKAARIAGISPHRVRTIETDAHQRLLADALRRAMTDDKERGLRPMMVAATAGTTDAGAIDPLPACADIAAEMGAWFHVDAAYGGFFQLTDRGREQFNGIERADSITVDAHKSLFLPFGLGGLLTRNPGAVVDAHFGEGAYMRDVAYGGLPHYMQMGPEQTRPNRGVPVWLSLQLHGIARFRDELDRMLDLARHAAQRLGEIAGVEILTAPELSVVVFRSTDGDDATLEVYEALNASGIVHVSSTVVDGKVYVRFAFLSQRTTLDVVDTAIDVVRTTVS